MLKKLGLPVVALAGLLAFAAPHKADARVRFGVALGGPVYTAPVPVSPYAYPYPAYGPDYYAAPAPYAYGYDPYAYPYVAPYYGGGVSIGIGGYGHGYRNGGHEGYSRGNWGHGGGHGRR